MIKFLDLKKSLASQVLPCYNIVGDPKGVDKPDSFVVQKAVDMFCQKIDIADFNISKLTSPTIDTIVEDCENLPIASEFRLVIVQDFSFKKSASKKTTKSTKSTKTQTQTPTQSPDDALVNYLTKPNPSTILLFVNCDITDISGIEQIDCSRLDTKTIESWIMRECMAVGCTIAKDAQQLLVDYCQSDMQRISHEVPKLCTFKPNDQILKIDVQNLVHADVSFKIYELSEAVAKQDADKAMSILDYLQTMGEDQVALLGLLYSHFRRLMFVSLNKSKSVQELSIMLGIKEYPAGLIKKQAEHFRVAQLKKILEVFWAIDTNFRVGKFPLDSSVQFAIMNII